MFQILYEPYSGQALELRYWTGGAIMARMDSSHPEAVCRHPKAQK